MKRPISVTLLLTLVFNVCHAQTALNYNSFLATVKKENPLAAKAYNINRYSKLQLRAARGNFDPQLNSGIENKYFNATDYYTLGRAELKQQLYTSQYLKIGYQYGQGSFLNPENYTPMQGISYIGVQTSLLQGLLFDKTRADLIKAKHYVDYYLAEEKIQLNDLLYTSSVTYVDYLYLKKNSSLYGYFLNLAGARLNGIKDLSEAGERATVDTVEAAILLQGRILDSKANELELIKKNNELMVFLQGVSGGPNNITITDSIDLIYDISKRAMSSQVLTENTLNPLIAQYTAKQKVLQTEVRLKKEMTKPVLDVNYNFLSNNNPNFSPGLSASNYKWGVTLALPLYFRKSVNEYKLSDIVAKNNQFELEFKQDQLSYKRNYLINAIEVLSNQILNAEKSSSYSRVLVEAEKIKFSNGESSLFLLNSRENKWLESELKLAEYKSKYVKLYLELVYINGNLTYELN